MMKVFNGAIALISFIILILTGDIRAGIVSLWSLIVYLNLEEA